MTTDSRWRKFWILLLVPASALVLQAALCGGEAMTEGETGDPKSVTVRLQNLDTPVTGDNIHILGPGEDYSSANRLAPGEFRNVVISMRQGQRVSFYAGRNGVTLSNGNKTCTCSFPCPTTPGTPKVEWSGSTLSCVGW